MYRTHVLVFVVHLRHDGQVEEMGKVWKEGKARGSEKARTEARRSLLAGKTARKRVRLQGESK